MVLYFFEFFFLLNRSAKQTSYLSILAFVAVGIGLVLVVGTVILALIPVFLAERSVAISDSNY